MLVLTRHPSQKIVIGDHIRLTVVAVRGKKVRLGIEAPKQVAVHRQEVYEALREQAAWADALQAAESHMPDEADVT